MLIDKVRYRPVSTVGLLDGRDVFFPSQALSLTKLHTLNARTTKAAGVKRFAATEALRVELQHYFFPPAPCAQGHRKIYAATVPQPGHIPP